MFSVSSLGSSAASQAVSKLSHLSISTSLKNTNVNSFILEQSPTDLVTLSAKLTPNYREA